MPSIHVFCSRNSIRYRSSSERLLGHLVEPVLLVVSHGVDRPQGPGIAFAELDRVVAHRELDASFEADRAACLPVEDGDTGLDESGFQQHLEAVLEVEQHLSRPSVIMWRVERLGRFDQRRHRLALQHARFLPQPHRLTRAAQRLAIAQPAFRAAAADGRIRSPRPPEASHCLRNIPQDT